MRYSAGTCKCPTQKEKKQGTTVQPPTRLAPVRVSAIVFGRRCDKALIDAVVPLFGSVDERPKFYGIQPRNDSFGLRRFPIDVDEIDASGVREPAFLEFRDVFVDGDLELKVGVKT